MRKQILVVSSYPGIKGHISDFERRGDFGGSYEFHFLIEYWKTENPSNLASNEVPCADFGNTEEVAKAFNAFATKRFDAIITDDEYSIYIAAKLRERMGIAGTSVADAIRLRDKVVMKLALDGSDIEKPRLYSLDELEAGQFSLPIVAKPRAFGGAIGVHILRSSVEVEALLSKLGGKLRGVSSEFRELSEDDLEFEDFVEGEIFHLDGVSLGGECRFFTVSRYLGTCVDFEKNRAPLGSVMDHSPAEREFWAPFVREVVARLQVPDGVFHLEAFKTPDKRKVFLEIAARPGGASVVPAVRLATGLDLRLIHLKAQLQECITVPDKFCGEAGWLVYPLVFNDARKITVKKAELTCGMDSIESLREMKLPASGTPATGLFSYLKNNGQFLYFSQNVGQVAHDLLTTQRSYSLEFETT